jgi:hypothetical protein
MALVVAAVTSFYYAEKSLLKQIIQMDPSTYNITGNGTVEGTEPNWPRDQAEEEEDSSVFTNSSDRNLKKCPYLSAISKGWPTKRKAISTCLQFNIIRGCGTCCPVSSDYVYYSSYYGGWVANCYCGTAGLVDAYPCN